MWTSGNGWGPPRSARHDMMGHGTHGAQSILPDLFEYSLGSGRITGATFKASHDTQTSILGFMLLERKVVRQQEHAGRGCFFRSIEQTEEERE